MLIDIITPLQSASLHYILHKFSLNLPKNNLFYNNNLLYSKYTKYSEI